MLHLLFSFIYNLININKQKEKQIDVLSKCKAKKTDIQNRGCVTERGLRKSCSSLYDAS